MKRNLIAIILILFAKFSLAQQELLSFDEHNKYIFYQVVDMPGLSVDSLHGRGMFFLKTLFPRIKFKTANNISLIDGDGKFITYTSLSVLKHENGEINYQVSIEFKDQKYRFWLTKFIFTPYERDRYGNFVPRTGIEIPLETAASKLDKKDLNGYLNETGAFCKQFAERLKVFMLNTPKKEESTKKIVTDKW
jgi:hypothetical protein